MSTKAGPRVLALCGAVMGSVCLQAAAEALVAYTLPDGTLYRIAAQDGAVPEDLSAALDQISPGSGDEWVSTSANGAWLLVSSERFDARCVGWPCLAVVTENVSAWQVIESEGDVIHAEGFGAISASGDLVVFTGGDGPHSRDIYAVLRSGGIWGTTLTLSATSVFAYNAQPALSADGARVVFDCADAPYGAPGTAICEVATDGSDLRVVFTPAEGPGGSTANALHHPAYAPDGGYVFEADWQGEQIWRLAAGATAPVQVAPTFNNDNSPCVFPDGRIASLWLDRPGGNGDHELKIMSADGISLAQPLLDVDILDGGITCADTSTDVIFADGFETGGTTAWGR